MHTVMSARPGAARVRLLFLTALVAIFFAPAREADACSCLASGPACQSFWTADAVFDATVLKIERLTPDNPSSPRPLELSDRVITFDVREAWKGVETGIVQGFTTSSGGACGYDFKVGARYLVFASRGRDGNVHVSICSLTREYNGSGESVDFLKSLASPETGGRVFGSVMLGYRPLEPGPDEYVRTPVDLEVRLTGNGRALTTTAAGGRYEFPGLPPGQYEVRVEVPQGYTTWKDAFPAEIPNRRACVQHDFRIGPHGRIAGRVVSSDQRGVNDVQIEVTTSTADLDGQPYLRKASTRSDGAGYFEVGELPPGRYIVGINLSDLPSQYHPRARVLYPGGDAAPMPIELSLGQRVDVGAWQIPPPLAVVRLTGIITYRDGTPVGGAYVGLQDIGTNPKAPLRGAGGIVADAEGRFVLEARQGRKYRFVARVGGNGSLERLRAPQIEAQPGLPPLQLIIPRDPPR